MTFAKAHIAVLTVLCILTAWQPVISQADPTNAQGWYDRGTDLMSKDNVDGAVGAFKKTLGLEPKHQQALTDLADAYSLQEDWANAAATYKILSEVKVNDFTIMSHYLRALENGNIKGPQQGLVKALYSLNKSDIVISVKYLKMLEESKVSITSEDYIQVLESLTQGSGAQAAYKDKLAKSYSKKAGDTKAVDPAAAEALLAKAAEVSSSGYLKTKYQNELAALKAEKQKLESAKAREQQLQKQEEERKAKEQTDRIAQEDAARQAKTEADLKSKEAADKRAMEQAERKEKERLAREERELKAKTRKDSLANAEATRRSKAEAERAFNNIIAAIGRMQTQALDTPAVIQQLDESLAKKPGDTKMAEARGILAYGQGDYALAINYLGKINTYNNHINRILALSYNTQGDFKNAAESFKKVPKLTMPKEEWDMYCNALIQSGQKDAGAREYEAYLLNYRDDEKAITFLIDHYREPLNKIRLTSKLESFVKLHPKDPKPLLELAELYGPDHFKGVEYRKKYLQLNPADSKADLELAAILEKRGNKREALEIFLKYADQSAGDFDYNIKLAEMLESFGRRKEAIPFYQKASDLKPGDSQLQLKLAELLEREQSFDKALDSYLKALDSKPKDQALQKKILFAAGKSKDKGRLGQIYLTIQERDPSAHDVQFKLAELYLAANDMGQAYGFLSKALKSSPGNANYEELLPKVIVNDEQIGAHYASLKKICLMPGVQPKAFLMLARAHELNKQSGSAAKAYGDAYRRDNKILTGKKSPIQVIYQSGDFRLAAALADAYLAATDPQDLEISEIQVNAYSKTNADDLKMRQAYANYLKLNPDANKWWLSLAKLDLKALDNKSAIKNTRIWIDKNPQSLEAYNFLLPLVEKDKEYMDLYAQVLSKLIELDKTNNSRHRLALGYLRNDQKNYPEALELLKAAGKAFSNDAQLWYTLGSIEARSEFEGDGSASFKKAYTLQPAKAEYARAYGNTLNSESSLKNDLELFQFLRTQSPTKDERIKLAKSQYLNGNYNPAAMEWDALLKEDAALAQTQPMVAETYIKARQYNKAVPIYTDMSQKDPGNLKTLETLMDLYQKAGDAKNQTLTMEKIVSVDPSYKKYQLELAQEMSKQGQSDKALIHYEGWVSRNSKDNGALEALHGLVEAKRDTGRLINVLESLTSLKGVSSNYHFQLAEIIYAQTGDVAPLERLVKAYPEYQKGRRILAYAYFKNNDITKLKGYEVFLSEEASKDKSLQGALAEVYAAKNKTAQANGAYYEYLQTKQTDRGVYDRVFAYSSKNKSPHINSILKIGYESFPQDLSIKYQYAKTLGQTPKALEIYREIFSKDKAHTGAVVDGAQTAVALKQNETAIPLLVRWHELEPGKEPPLRHLVDMYKVSGESQKRAQTLEKIVDISSKRRPLFLELAEVYKSLKNIDQAMGAYSRLLEEDPKDKEAQELLSTLIRGTGDKKKLKETLLFIEQRDSKAHKQQFELAGLFLQEKDKTSAYEYLNRALASSPNNTQYQSMLPLVISSDQQVQENFQILKALAAKPDASPELIITAAHGYALNKNTPMAAEEYKRAHKANPALLKGQRNPIVILFTNKDYALAGLLAGEYVKSTDPQDIEIRTIQVKAYELSGADKPMLRSAIKALVELDPGTSSWWLKLAQLDLDAGDTTSAIKHGKTWVERNSASLNGYTFLLPLVMGRANELETHASVLEKLIELEPKKASEYCLSLGILRFQQKNWVQAKEQLDKSVKDYSTRADLWFMLGQLMEQPMFEGNGEKEYKKAYSLMPDNLQYARKYGSLVASDEAIKGNLKLFQFLNTGKSSESERVKLAKSLYLNGKYKESADQWEAVLAGNKGIAEKEPAIALAFFKSGQLVKALPLYEAASQRNPSDISILDTLCLIYEKQGKKNKHFDCIKKIVNLDPAYNEYQLLLAREFLRREDSNGAISNYELWVNRKPKDKDALMALHSLVEAKKDTGRLVTALEMLTRIKGVPNKYHFQLGELRFMTTGDVSTLKSLVKTYPSYTEGKTLLILAYFKNREYDKLTPYELFMSKEASKDNRLYGPLAEVYANKKKSPQANSAFYNYLKTVPGDRGAFDRVYVYAKNNSSIYIGPILEMAYKWFPDDLQLKYEYARSLGKTEEALKVYKEVLAVDKNHLNAVKYGAGAAMGAGKTSDAESLYTMWANLEPGNDEPLKALVSIYSAAKDDAHLAGALEALIGVTDKKKALLMDLGEVYQRLKKSDQTIETYKRVLDISPKDTKAQELLIEAVNSTGNDARIKEVHGFIEQRDPEAHKSQFAMALIYLKEKDKNTAYFFLDKAIKNQPGEPTYLALLPEVVESDDQVLAHYAMLKTAAAKPGAKAELKFMLARAHNIKGDKASAAMLFSQVYKEKASLLKGKKAPVVSLYNAKQYSLAGELAAAYLAQKDGSDRGIREIQVKAYEQTKVKNSELRKAMSALVSLDPATADWWLKLARLDLEENDKASAIKHAKTWVERQPSDINGYKFLLPLVEKVESESQTYGMVLERLIELEPKTAAPYHLQLGFLRYKEQNYIPAGEHLLKASQNYPENGEMWYVLGKLSSQQGIEGDGRKEFAKAHALSPNNIEYARAYASLLKTNSQIKANLDLFERLNAKVPSVDEKIKFAKALYLNGEYKASAEGWEALLKMSPELGTQEPLVSQAYYNAGMIAKAQLLFENRSLQDPSNLSLVDTLLLIYEETKNKAKHVSLLERIVELEPSRKNYQLRLARRKVKMGKTSAAIHHYEQWVARKSTDTEALKELLDLTRNARDTTRIMTTLELLVNNKAASTKEIQELAELKFQKFNDPGPLTKEISRDKNYYRGRALMAGYYYNNGNFDKLLAYEKFLAENAPKNPELNAPLAEAYVAKKQYSAANGAYYNALKHDSKNRDLYQKVLEFSQQQKSPHLKGVLEIGYNSFPEDLYIKIEYAKALGSTSEALVVYKDILKKDPNNAEVVAKAAPIAYAQKDKDTEALLQKWANLVADASKPHELLVNVYKATKNQNKMVASMEDWRQRAPQDHELAYRTAMEYKKMGKVSKAVSHMQNAADMQPKSTIYTRELGLLLVADKKLDWAENYLKGVYSSKKFDEEVTGGLALIYQTSGRKKEARGMLQELVANKPYKKEYAFPLAILESEYKSPSAVIKVLTHQKVKPELDADMSFLLLKAYIYTKQDNAAGLFGAELATKYPEKSKKSLELGILFYERGRKADARKILENVVRSQPTPESHYYLAKLEMDDKNWKSAINYFSKAQEHSKLSLKYMGEANTALKNYRDAIASYEAYFDATKKTSVLSELLKLYRTAKDVSGEFYALERLVRAEPENMDYRTAMAEAYLRNGDMTGANKQFRYIIKRNPKHPEANLYLGMENARSNQCGTALKRMPIGFKKVKDNAEAYKLAGRCYLEQKKSSSALIMYERSFKLNPKDYDVAMGKLKLVKSLKRQKELTGAYADVVSLDSNFVEGLKVLAKDRFKAKKFPEAVKLYTRLVMHVPDDQQIWENYGHSLLEVKNVKEAKYALQSAIQLGAKGVNIRLMLARMQYEDGQLNEAENLFKEVVGQKPDAHDSYYWLAQIALKHNQTGVAADYLQKALKYAPKNARYAELLGSMHFKVEEYGDAIKVLEPVKNELTADARLMYADALANLGRLSLAFTEYREINSKNPSAIVTAKMADIHILEKEPKKTITLIESSKFANDPVVMVPLAKAKLEMSEIRQAKELLNDLIKNDRENAQLYFLMGMAEFKDQDFKKAKKQFDKAIKYQPQYPEAIYQMGICDLKRNDPEDAMGFFQELTQHESKKIQAQGNIGLAMCFEKQGKVEAVEHHLKKAMGILPSAEVFYRLTMAAIKMNKLVDAQKWADNAKSTDRISAYTAMAQTELLLAKGQKHEALDVIKNALSDHKKDCEVIITYIKANWINGFEKPVTEYSDYVSKLCPEDPMPYYYMGLVAHTFYDKRSAKKHFKHFLKFGGDKSELPKGY